MTVFWANAYFKDGKVRAVFEDRRGGELRYYKPDEGLDRIQGYGLVSSCIKRDRRRYINPLFQLEVEREFETTLDALLWASHHLGLEKVTFCGEDVFDVSHYTNSCPSARGSYWYEEDCRYYTPSELKTRHPDDPRVKE